MDRHLAAAVWFQECSQQQEAGRVLRIEQEGLSSWKSDTKLFTLDIDR